MLVVHCGRRSRPQFNLLIMEKLNKIELSKSALKAGGGVEFVSYQQFGPPLHSAPVVVVLHALSGNSNVSGANGWWNGLIGSGKTINTDHLTVIAFNVPGNGYDGQLLENPYAYRLGSVALWIFEALDHLKIKQAHAVIGGSLGGCLAWQLVAQRPDFFRHLIPIAAHWKASPWVVAQGIVQDRILSNSNAPIKDARMHAMTFYRNPGAFQVKFSNDDGAAAAASTYDWLHYHGGALKDRFALSAYKFMNWLLTTHEITDGERRIETTLKAFSGRLHLVGIQDDLLYTEDDILKTAYLAKELGLEVDHYTIRTDQGHDAFLIEQRQLSQFLFDIFNVSTLKNENYELSESPR